MHVGRDLVVGVVLGILLARCVAGGPGGVASARSSGDDSQAPRDLDELARIYAEDQGDRMPGGGKPIDWSVVGPRDKGARPGSRTSTRRAALHTGKDFYRAAMVLQHSSARRTTCWRTSSAWWPCPREITTLAGSRPPPRTVF